MLIKSALQIIFVSIAVRPITSAPLNTCPLTSIREIIRRTVNVNSDDAALQTQMIRKIMEEKYGGTWGVIVVTDTELISNNVHWTIPELKDSAGIPAFCLHVYDGWQYNVFKTSNSDSKSRGIAAEFASDENGLIDDDYE